MKPTVKHVAECLLIESMGFGFDEVFPRAEQEGGPVKVANGVASFALTFFRRRGAPKRYEITVEEIS